MKARCYNPRYGSYSLYGGRGIAVCERWRTSFEDFLADMGRKPTPSHTIDRIDSEGHYDPTNCRWATATEQARNRSCTKMVDFEGARIPLAEACERLGISYAQGRRKFRDQIPGSGT
jgi:hypothetical protein